MTAGDIIRAGALAECRPWPRRVLSSDEWRAMAAALPAEPGLAFIALWADTVQVHALFHAGAPLIVSVPVEAGLYAGLSPARPGAALFERMVADLWGHQSADALDTRPWLDHGTWPLLRPLSERPAPNAGGAEVPELQDAPGQVLSWGPLPPGFATRPGHWRAAVEGGEVTHLEARLGYAHRGIFGLMRGKSPAGAARLAARIDGAATVAHTVAFARAIEAAQDSPAPPRAEALRELMLAIERVAVGLADIAAVGRPAPQLAAAREALLVACEAAFGHRLMMDVVRPGGVQGDFLPDMAVALDDALADVSMAGLGWRAGLGVLPIGAAFRIGVGGVIGRASGRPDPAAPDAPIEAGGDLAARMGLRVAALADDVLTAREALAALPEGAVIAPLPHAAGEGLGVANGPQGQVWHWVRVAGGVVSACFAADPAWLAMPALEQAAIGCDVADLPAVAASFGVRVAGMDV